MRLLKSFSSKIIKYQRVTNEILTLRRPRKVRHSCVDVTFILSTGEMQRYPARVSFTSYCAVNFNVTLAVYLSKFKTAPKSIKFHDKYYYVYDESYPTGNAGKSVGLL